MSWKSDELSDWTIVVHGKAYPLHSYPLCRGPRKGLLLEREFTTSQVNHSHTSFQHWDPRWIAVWELALDFIYDENYSVFRAATAVPLLGLANFLESAALYTTCEAFIDRQMDDPEHAFAFYLHASELNMLDMAASAARVVAGNIDSFPRDTFSVLNTQQLLHLLRHPHLKKTKRGFTSHLVTDVLRHAPEGTPLSRDTLEVFIDLAQPVHPKDAIYLLSRAVKISCSKAAAVCTPSIVNYFEELDLQDIGLLPVNVLIPLLVRDDLKVQDEDVVYHVISAYVDRRRGQISSIEARDLWECCRLSWLRLDTLTLALDSAPQRGLSSDLLVEALMTRLLRHEMPGLDSSQHQSDLALYAKYTRDCPRADPRNTVRQILQQALEDRTVPKQSSPQRSEGTQQSRGSPDRIAKRAPVPAARDNLVSRGSNGQLDHVRQVTSVNTPTAPLATSYLGSSSSLHTSSQEVGYRRIDSRDDRTTYSIYQDQRSPAVSVSEALHSRGQNSQRSRGSWRPPLQQ